MPLTVPQSESARTISPQNMELAISATKSVSYQICLTVKQLSMFMYMGHSLILESKRKNVCHAARRQDNQMCI